MHRDRLRLELTAASAEAARAYDDTVWAYVSFARDPGAQLKRTLQADAAMPMAHVLKGYFMHLMGVPALLPQARAAHTAATKAGATSERERAHLAALGAWCEGELERACAIFEQILAAHPRDILALKLANYLYFYLGDAAGVRDGPARVLHAWNEGVTGYGYVLALHAFGLEECGEYDAAERAGRRATELNPADPWAVHSVAHVMEMQDRADEGVRWIATLAPHWNTANFFRFHLWWHLALANYGLERYDQVLALYDARVWGEGSSENLSLCNDISLLARLELAGVDVGARWQPLAALVKGQLGVPVLAFQDAHYALALAAGGEGASATALLEGLRAPEGAGSTARVHAAAGRALCEAVVAWRDRDYARVTELLAPARSQLWRIGGSHAQRDLFTLIVLDAALRCGEAALARELRAERAVLRPAGKLPSRLTADKE